MSNVSNIVEKIKKCLALTKSANPHEAAAALRHAQKLAAAYNIPLNEVGEGFSEAVKTSEIVRPSLPEWLLALVGMVCYSCGVEACTDVSGRFRSIRYMGVQHRVKMAAHAHVVIQRALDESWAGVPRGMKSGMKGSRSSYFIAWLAGFRTNLLAYAKTEQDVAAIEAQKNANIVSDKSAKASNQKFELSDATSLGYSEGSKFKLHRAVDGVATGQLQLSDER